MAGDVAELGISVDSEGVQTGVDRLTLLQSVARRTGETVDQVKARFDQAAQSTRDHGAASEQASQQIQRLQSQVQRLEGEINRLNTASARSAAEISRLGTAYQASTAAANNFLRAQIGLVAGFLAPAAAIKAFFENTIEAEKAQQELANTLQATGGVAGQTLESLNDMAKSLQDTTTFSDEAVNAAQNILLRFPLVREEFNRATKAAVDLAAATGKDLPSAARIVGQALDNPATAARNLRAANILLTESQKQQIESALEQGDALKAQGIILTQMEARYKGAAVAARDTLGGALEALKNQIGELFEQDAKGEATQNLRKSIESLTTALKDPQVKSAIDSIGSAIFNGITKFIQEAIREWGRFMSVVNSFKMGEIAVAFRTGLGLVDVEQGGSFEKEAKALEDTINGLEKRDKALKINVGTNAAYQKSLAGVNKESLTALDVLRNNVSALGGAATAAEKYELQVAELADKLQQGTISVDTFNRAVAFLNPTTTAVRTTITEMGEAIGRAFTQGKSLADGFKSSLASIASSNISKTINTAINGITGAGFDFTSFATTGIIGLGASLLSRIFGDSSKAEQEAEKQRQALQEAKNAFAGMTKQIEDFNRAAAGLVKGELRTSIDTLESQRQPLAAAALKAENFAGFAAIQETFRKGVARLVDEFQRSLPALHQMLNAEGGLSGARAQAIANVENFRLQILGLKDSIEQASLAMSSSEILSQWDIFANEAQNAALAMIGQTQAQSELVVELHRAQNTAAALQGILVELGMSAEDAAAAIDAKLTEAIKKLQGEFMDSLIRAVNELAGGAWINQAEDLVKAVAQLRSDALALGIETSLIDTFYVLSAQKIVDENELVGDSFNALARMLGLTGTSLHEFKEKVEEVGKAAKRSAEEIASTIQGFQDDLFIAQQDTDTLAGALAVFDLQAQRRREAEIKAGGEAIVALEALIAQERLNIIQDFAERALEEQKKALEDQIAAIQDQIEEQNRIIADAQRDIARAAEAMADAMADAVKVIEDARRSIQNFISGFLGSSQSFLSPQQQMNTAIATFNQQRALAASGDQNALQGITSVAQNALDAIKRYFGSTAAGAAQQQSILNSLAGLPAALSPEMFIEKAIRDQTATQTAEAQAALANAQSQLAQLQQQLAAAQNALATLNTQTVPIQTTATQTGATKTSVDSAKAALDVANSQLTSINNAVINLVRIDSRLAEANTYLAPIRQMTAQQNLVWYYTGQFIQLPTFAKGGMVEGPSHAGGGVNINVEGGEMIMSRRAVASNRGALEAMNRGGDDMLARINATLQRIVGAVVIGSEAEQAILHRVAGSMQTIARADRRQSAKGK